MFVHFIWLGSIPKAELIAKIAAKMRYLKAMFINRSNLTFYLWTTSDLKNPLLGRFASQEQLTEGGRLNLTIKNINELFGRSAFPYFSREEMFQLQNLFIKESSRSSTRAIGVDMLKFLILFHFGGFYMDAGLEIESGDMSAEAIRNSGVALLKRLELYSYGLSYIKNRVSYPFDLQIMYSKVNPEAQAFFAKVMTDIVSEYENDFRYDSKYNKARANIFIEGKPNVYTGRVFGPLADAK